MSNDRSDDVSFTDRIDLLCDEFEREWIAGRKPQLEDFLSKLPANDRKAAFSELLKVELEYRSRNGDSATDGEYRDRFPDRTVVVSEVFGKYVNMPTRFGDSRTDASLSGGPQTRDPGDSSPLISEQFGDFELQKELAQGGMGVVYRARQISLNRTVALKMILSGRLASDEEIKRFHSEAQVAAGFDHPGIVPVYEAGTYEGRQYIAMAYVEGPSLADLLKDGPLSPREGAQKILAVAQAVQYAHEKGVIHRDLKPANVLLDNSGQPRVTDFGLSRQLKQESALTETGRVLGTPGYMPPEQAEGRVTDIGPAADVYSLGAMLYAALTGRPPFQAACLSETLRQVIDQDPVPPRQLINAVDRDLVTICLKCLQKEPDRRYTSATELADDLDRFLTGESIHARPAGRMERAWRWTRRHPARAALLAVGFVALLCAVGLGVAFGYQKQLETANDNLATANGSLKNTNEQLNHSFGREKTLNRQLQTALTETRSAKEAESKAKNALQTVLYARRISFALSALQNDDVVLARKLLAECPESQRHWEWHYVYRLCHRGKPVMPPITHVRGFMIDPNLQTYAIVLQTGDVQVIDWRSRKHICTLQVTKGRIPKETRVTYNANGQQIATARGPIVEIWDTKNGRKSLTLKDHALRVEHVAFHPDGNHIVTGDANGTIRFWNIATGALLRTIANHRRFRVGTTHRTPQVAALKFSPNGNLLVCSYNLSGKLHAKCFEWSTGRELQLFEDAGAAVEFSPDGALLAMNRDGDIVLWDIPLKGTQQLRVFRGHASEISSIRFSPDGAKLISGGRDTVVRVWDVRRASPIARWWGHASAPTVVACTNDGSTVVTASVDSVIAWSLPDVSYRLTRYFGDLLNSTPCNRFQKLKMNYILDHYGANLSKGVIFSSSLSVTKVNQIDAFDVKAGFRVIALQAKRPQRRVSTDASGTRLATIDHRQVKATIWDAATGKPLATVEGHADQIQRVILGAKGQRLATAGKDGQVCIWDVLTGRELWRLRNSSSVRIMAFSPNGRLLVCADADQVLTVWNVESGKKAYTKACPRHGRYQKWTGFTFSSDGKYLAVTSSAKVLILNTSTGSIIHSLTPNRQLLNPKPGSLQTLTGAISFSTDNKRLAVGVGAIIVLYDTASVQQVLTLHTKIPAKSIGFSNDGTQVRCLTLNGNLIEWNADSGKW